MTTLIDDFTLIPGEDPLSHGGLWVQNTGMNASPDRLITDSNGADSWGGGFGQPPAYAIRQSSPNASTDQDFWLTTQGTYSRPEFNSVSILLRMDNFGNGYEVNFYSRGAFGDNAVASIISKWVSGAPTILTSVFGVTGISGGPANMSVRASVVGNTITAQAMGSSGPWVPVLTTTDSTYTSGLMGIGSHGMHIHQVYQESVPGPTGVFNAPWLVAYGSPTPKP